MLAIYTHPKRYVRTEAGESVPAFVPFDAGSVWFVRMSRADRKLMTVDEYVQQVSRMTDRQLEQACRNRGLDEVGESEDLRDRLTSCCYPETPLDSDIDEPATTGNIDLTQLPESDKLSFRDLQRLLKDAGLSAAGTYDELVERLKEVEVEA